MRAAGRPPSSFLFFLSVSGTIKAVNDLFSLISRHGYLVVCAVVFCEAIGLPMPAAVALVAGGAASASGVLHFPVLVGLAMPVMLVGDTLLYFAGRYFGWSLLGFLCRVSANPESCILRSAESFYKRGRITLVFAKFIPGVNTMAPPLAGSMKMRLPQFLGLDLTGAALYILAYAGLGYVFRDFLAAITHAFMTAGRVVELTVVVGLAVYAGYRVWLYRKNRIYGVVPRIHVEQLVQRLVAEDSDRVVMVDVRSHGYYDADAVRIKGSQRLEPNNLTEELKNLPKDREIYLYCT